MVALLRVQLPAAFCLPYLSLTPDFFSCSYFVESKKLELELELDAISQSVCLPFVLQGSPVLVSRTHAPMFVSARPFTSPFSLPRSLHLSLHLSRPSPSRSFTFFHCLCRSCTHLIYFPSFFYFVLCLLHFGSLVLRFRTQ